MFPFLSNPATFLRASSTRIPAGVVAVTASKNRPPLFAVAGVPWDGAVTNRPGARFGPSRIRAASHMLCDATHPFFGTCPVPELSAKTAAKEEVEQAVEQLLVDVGDFVLPNTDLERMRRQLESIVATSDAFAADPFPQGGGGGAPRRVLPVFLGGDHSITLSTLRGIAARRRSAGEGCAKFACIHFDAHCDTWSDHFGEPSGHGTWVKDAIEGYAVEGASAESKSAPVLDPECTFQIGIRSSGERAATEYVSDRGGIIFTGRSLRGVDRPAELRTVVVDRIVERLAAKRFPPLYLSFDIDAIDPAFAPGTGTPEPGGLSSAQALTLVEELSARPELRECWAGMDVVEVAPAYDDASGNTANVAAHIAWTWMCGVLKAHQQQQQRS